jgi:2-hydroxychromene-2-carboxylate isomerase
MSPPSTIELFYDPASPHSYLAVARVELLAWRPGRDK